MSADDAHTIWWHNQTNGRAKRIVRLGVEWLGVVLCVGVFVYVAVTALTMFLGVTGVYALALFMRWLVEDDRS